MTTMTTMTRLVRTVRTLAIATYDFTCPNCRSEVVNGVCTNLDCPLSKTGNPCE